MLESKKFFFSIPTYSHWALSNIGLGMGNFHISFSSRQSPNRPASFGSWRWESWIQKRKTYSDVLSAAVWNDLYLPRRRGVRELEEARKEGGRWEDLASRGPQRESPGRGLGRGSSTGLNYLFHWGPRLHQHSCNFFHGSHVWAKYWFTSRFSWKSWYLRHSFVWRCNCLVNCSMHAIFTRSWCKIICRVYLNKTKSLKAESCIVVALSDDWKYINTFRVKWFLWGVFREFREFIYTFPITSLFVT